MRTRTNDNRSTMTVSRTYRATCTAGFTTYYTSATVGSLKTIVDCPTPNYYATLKRGGVLPYLPLTILNEMYECQALTYSQTRTTGTGAPCSSGTGSYCVESSLLPASPSMPALDSAAISYVVNAAIASAKSEVFDALTAYVELHKSLSMVANRINRVFGIAHKAARKASKEKPYKQLQTFNQLWLEARFGWRPLVHDVSNAIDQYHSSQTLMQSGKRSVSVDLSATATPKVTTDSSIWTGSRVRTGTRTYRGFAMAVGKFGESAEFRPFQTAWELVPYSFVVDWFFDISSYISAVTPIPGVDIRASGYSIKDEYEELSGCSVVSNPALPTYTISMGSPYRYLQTVRNYSRYPSSTIAPSFYPRLNSLKLVDIAALVLQRSLPLSRFYTVR